MKKLLVTLMIVAGLLMSFGIAQSMDKAEAMAKGYGMAVGTPDGKVPLESGWNILSPAWFYTDSSSETLYFKAGTTTYSFTKVVNQIAMANCISAGRSVYLNVESSYISAGGCLPF